MQIEGTISRILFNNDSNGYTVAIFDTEDGAIRVTGNLHEAKMGVKYRLEGDFVVHRKYGEQFAFTHCEEPLPEGKSAILDFLASGAIRGIGPKIASSIVDVFGEDSLSVIEEEPEKLLSIRGIGKKNVETIKESFAESRAFARASLELQELGLSMADTVSLYKKYGSDSIAMVKENPYFLFENVRGFTFQKADEIARRVGIDEDDEVRLRSAIKYILSTHAYNGSTLMPEEKLIERVIALIDTTTERIKDAIQEMAFEGDLITDTIEGQRVIYLYGYYQAEQRIAFNLKRLKTEKTIHIPANIDNLIADAEARLSEETGGEICLSENQRNAVRTALLENVSIITGGPGTGKTTIINVIVKIFERLEIDTALAAPTGRAAKRMEETSGKLAMTIHRLLDCAFSEDDERMFFGRNEEEPLEQMAIIVDEASMIDILLMDGLLQAIQSGAKLIITGDADQLPSVGAGNVLRDIIKSEYVKTIRLKEIYRQSGGSLIVTNAHLINNGEYPMSGEGERDFYIMTQSGEEQIAETIKDLTATRLPSYYDFIESSNDIQVLTPTKKGPLGSQALNKMLQDVINPKDSSKAELKLGSRIFRTGDKVMQLRNDYQAEWTNASTFESGKGIFNGDIGIIESVDEEDKSLLVRSDDRLITYEGEMFEDIDLAYAITVHKSQGNEFPAVIIPIWRFPPMLMTRNLLYTAITRGKKLVILVGSPNNLRQMIDNNRIDERDTGLKNNLEKLYTV